MELVPAESKRRVGGIDVAGDVEVALVILEDVLHRDDGGVQP